MNPWLKYLLYFAIGGLLVSASTYFGAKGKGFLAAFASTFPVITGVTFILIYLNGGTEHTYSYAKHLLWFVPPWIAYVGFVILTIHRLGFWGSIAGGLAIYMAAVGLIKLALR
ncbi:MAG: DUF3147 domain-containing protein [Nitrospirales bacterium]